MIVRVWEAEVKPGKMDQLLDLIRTTLLPRVAVMDGFLGIEFFRAMQGENGILTVSRWRDEEAIAAYAGPLWEFWTPKVDSLAADCLAHPSAVHHYVPVEIQQPVAAEPADPSTSPLAGSAKPHAS
jgi:quinol monooxygenase YgiN